MYEENTDIIGMAMDKCFRGWHLYMCEREHVFVCGCGCGCGLWVGVKCSNGVGKKCG